MGGLSSNLIGRRGRWLNGGVGESLERPSVSGLWPRPRFPPRGVKPHHLLSLSLLLKETITGIKPCNRIITSHNNIIGLNTTTTPLKVFVGEAEIEVNR